MNITKNIFNSLSVFGRLIVIFTLLLAACGGGGGSAGSSSPADFQGVWSGSYNGVDLSYSVTQTGGNLTMIRTSPYIAGLTYKGAINGNSTVVDTFYNNVYIGSSTWVLLSNTTVNLTINSCIPSQGLGCGAPNGTVITLRRLVLTDISVTPISASIPKGQPISFASMGTYSNGISTYSSNVTDQLTWTSSNTGVASIDTNGVASTLSLGNTTITASAKGITSNSANLSVTAALLTSIAITPTTSSVAKGLTTIFSAIGTYSDGTTSDISNQATWSTSNPSIATIISTTGVATGANVGSTTVFASFNGITSITANLAVNNAVLTGLSISPVATSIPKGLPATFTATGSYSDGSTGNVSGAVNWTSSDTNIAVMNASGIASTLSQGNSNITASANGLTSNSSNLTVIAPILTTLTITPSNQNILVGNTQQFSANGTLSDGSAAKLGTLTWSSSNTSVSTINNSGLATTLISGSTNISVSSSGVTSNNAVLTVAPLYAPYAPIDLFAISGLGQVTLSWSPASNATSYNIYWGFSPGVTSASNKISGVTSPYIQTGLTSNSTIYYRVSAVKSGTEILSNEIFSYVYNGGNPIGNWVVTNSPLTARRYHTATLLQNGKVLVTGGLGADLCCALATAELYDPTTETWTATGSLSTARYLHTATLLPNGKILVVGGYDPVQLGGNSSAELYDPISGTWSTTGNLSTSRYDHTATLLPNNKVLVVGGNLNGNANAELYDPSTAAWSATGVLTTKRRYHTETLMPNGKVLISGGQGVSGTIASSDLYDPATDTWAASGYLLYPRENHTATLLPSGKVLVAGGSIIGGVYAFPQADELYDYFSKTWTATGSLASHQVYNTATLLPNGNVLAAFGYGGGSAEIYNSDTGGWTNTGNPIVMTHGQHTATLLPNGKVLVVGGYDLINNAVISTAVLFQ